MIPIGLEIFCDSSSKLTLMQVMDKNFDPLSNQSLGCFECTYWIKFTVADFDHFKEGNLITNNVSRIARLYYKGSDGKYKSLDSVGFHLPYPMYNNYFYPYIRFPISDSAIYYLKFQVIEGKNIPAYMGVGTLADTDYLMHYSMSQYIYMTIIITVLILVAFFTFITYYKLHEQMYLWYFCYLCSAVGFILIIFNIPFRFLYAYHFTMWQWFNSYALFHTAMTVFLNLYSRSFLNLRQHAPILYMILGGISVIKILFFVAGVFFNETIASYLPSSSYFHNPIIDFICLVPAFMAGIYILWQGKNFAIYFVVAFALILSGFIIHAFGMSIQFSLFKELTPGFVSNTFFDLITLEVLLFTIAMAERFRLTRRERENAMHAAIEQLKENALLKEQVNNELERKVAERTIEIQKQAEEINRINNVLLENNLKLTENVKDLTKAKVTHQQVSFDEFKLTYPDEQACFRYLSELKWGKGFRCRKCSNTSFIEGKTIFAKRCNKCWYEETPTVGTIFYKLKFPIEKAFYLLFLVTNHKKISIEELAKTLQLSERTCWSYKNKIAEAVLKRKGKTSDSWEAIILM